MLLQIKIDFNGPFLRIFYHTVNDSILEIDSNSSNYSIPVDFTGKTRGKPFPVPSTWQVTLFDTVMT